MARRRLLAYVEITKGVGVSLKMLGLFVQIIVYRGHGTPNCHSWGWGSRLGAGWIRTGCGGRSGVLAASVSGHSYANQDNQVEGDDDQKSEKVGVHISPK
mgnify:CR=1 FL=1